DLPARLLALAQALSVTERQLHGSPLNIRRVVSRICGALFRGSLAVFNKAQSMGQDAWARCRLIAAFVLQGGKEIPLPWQC
ncbi:hypothetical protein QYG06_16300, partial [Xanthomonas euvesicatoria]|uniref:hypothetical protein n=1 Tax=Xanthomonas euvesicatoria TaxID=456327 RepID=UPI00321AA445